jgi:hypothetical protein|tara:strand:+ start:914 stop:1168 length:255 start_codon:yes stop_codon:yes gene_type:complete
MGLEHNALISIFGFLKREHKEKNDFSRKSFRNFFCFQYIQKWKQNGNKKSSKKYPKYLIVKNVDTLRVEKVNTTATSPQLNIHS